MSHYTTQTRWIVEMATPDAKGLPWRKRIKQACPSIFDFDFPIWNEQYRIELESKIIGHFFMWEIGYETVGLWKFALEQKLLEIMPYYNELYKTTVRDFDYLTDTDITETLQRNENKTEDKTENVNFSSKEDNDTDTTEDYTGSSTANGNTKTVKSGAPTSHTAHSDFPQAPLGTSDYASYEDYRQDKLDETVNTDTLDDTESTGKTIRTTNQDVDFTSSNKLTGNLTSDTDTSHTIHKAGTNGSRSFTELLIQYRDSLLNIDMQIIEELQSLFMSVY